MHVRKREEVQEVLRDVEKRAVTSPSRRCRSAQIERYIEAYREQPESDAEVKAARSAAQRTLTRLHWDDE